MDEITGKRPPSPEHFSPGSLGRPANSPLNLHKKIARIEEEKTTPSLIGRATASAAAINPSEEIQQIQFSKVVITVEEGDPLDVIFTKKNYSFDLAIGENIFTLKTDREELTNEIIYQFPKAFTEEKFSLRIQATKNKKELDNFIKEGVSLLLMKEASYVLGALDVGVIENIVVFFSKISSGFSLEDFLIKRNLTYSVSQKLSILLDIAKGLKELHDKNFIHRNLYIKNVFINYRGTALISDLSNCISTEEKIRDCKGYIAFKAPETLNCHPEIEKIPTKEFLKQPHTTAVDIYSLGILAYVFLTQKMLPSIITETKDLDLSAITERLTKNMEIPKLTLSPSASINQSLQDFIQACLRLNPQERPSIDIVIENLKMLIAESKSIPPSPLPTFAEISLNPGPLNKNFFIDPLYRFTIAANGEMYDLQGLGLNKEQKIAGAGSFGRIFITQDERIAVKVSLAIKPHQLNRLEQEGVILLLLKNAKYALGAFSVGFEERTLFAFMNYIKGSTLKEKIEIPKSLTLSQKTEILLGVALGLQELHAIGFVHRDLKPENILVDKEYKARVIDFGLASRPTTLKTRKGTIAYMAPEVLVNALDPQKLGIQIDSCLKQEKGFPIDVYSFGLVAYELLSNQEITKFSQSRLIRNASLPKNSYDDYPISPTKRTLLIQLVEGCLKLNPLERLTIPEIISKIEEIKSSD